MAQKVLRTTLDYKIESAGNVTIGSTPGGTITIDTGPTGTTYVTGDLVVQGTTTTVDSTIVRVKDNILILNYGETGAGVTLVTSGIEIDRGISPNAQVIWDESFSKFIMYKEKDPLNTLADLRVKSIELQSGNTVNNIDNDVTLSGNSPFSVPTQYAVKTYVDNQVALFSNYIFQNDSSVSVYDTGTNSYVETVIDGVIVSRLNGTGLQINQVTSYSTDTDLTLTANGFGEIILSKVVQLPYQISAPSSIASTNKIYAATPANGGSGVFFVNPAESDELVSKKKAILYGIIF